MFLILLFILIDLLGSDPTNQLLRYARDSRGSTLHMDIVSLGQGQGPRAEELITKSFLLKGRWIFLQNCHLKEDGYFYKTAICALHLCRD